MMRALVVDDEPSIAKAFEAVFQGLNCPVDIVPSAEEGLRRVQTQQYNVIVLDVRLPGLDGVQALPLFRKHSDAPLIVTTAFGTLDTAVSVVQEGAFEYLPKPFDLERLTDLLQRALDHSDQQHNRPRSAGEPVDTKTSELVGDSLPMQHLFRQIALAAQHDAPVLITGASGTGKELVARAIHRHSGRRDQPLVPVHLASLSDSLMERELFGHEAGAFTGAERAQSGVLDRADQGTLFLDEIGETPPEFQVKLLRLLETQEFYPVGSSVPQRSNFRLIAATNRPVHYLRDDDRFRSDFFFRLATIQIHVPTLQEHAEDIPALAQHFLHQHMGDRSRTFSPAALQILRNRNYPGNIRELRNVVIRAAAGSAESEIGVHSLPAADDRSAAPSTDSADSGLVAAVRRWAEQELAEGQQPSLQTCQQLVEAELIRIAMRHCGGNRTAAARLLNMHRETLRDRLNRQAEDRD